MITYSYNFSFIPLSYSQNVCIRQECGFCCIQYSLCPDDLPWSIDNNSATAETGSDCTNDYIEITNVSTTCNSDPNAAFASRLCGSLFSAVNGGPTSVAYVCGKFEIVEIIKVL